MNGVDVASQHAAEFCRRNWSWKRVCDVADLDSLQVPFDQLPESHRKIWTDKYRDDAEAAWREDGSHPMWHRFGFIDEEGRFCDDVRHVKGNMMMVVQTDGRRGIYYQGGRWARSFLSRKRRNTGSTDQPASRSDAAT